MAHNKQERDTIYGIEQHWHGLSQVRQLLTKDECFGWKVLLAQAAYQVFMGADSEPITMVHTNRYLPIASDDHLPLGNGTVIDIDTYSPHTPSEAWKYMEDTLKGTNYTVVSAGTVANRGKFFISIKLNELEAIKSKDGSATEMIFNFLGSLDKTLRHHMNISALRTVCQNTLMANYLMKTDFSARFKHSKNLASKLEAHKPIVEQAVNAKAIIESTFNRLIETPCNKDRARNIYTGFLVTEANKQLASAKKEPISELSTRMENQIEEHVTSFEKGKGNHGANEYDLLNGFTEPRSTGFSYGDVEKFKTFESSEFGTYSRQKAEFSGLLAVNREQLAVVEQTGASLMSSLLNRTVTLSAAPSIHSTDFARLLGR